MTKTILVIEDEFSIATLLKYNLEQAGYVVETAADGQEGLEKAIDLQPNLILLDLMLPKLDGMEVCKQIRQQRMNTPIIMLTAKDDEFDKVLGLELGADDYMTKPFSPREVLARVKAVLRRFTQNVVADDKDEAQEKCMSLDSCECTQSDLKYFYRMRHWNLPQRSLSYSSIYLKIKIVY